MAKIMNLEEYIKTFAGQNAQYEFWRGSNYGTLVQINFAIKILDFTDDSNYNLFNQIIHSIDDQGALFIIGGLPLVYQLVKLRYPILIFEEDKEKSVVLPYKQDHYHLDISVIPKMREENYWSYLELWNKQGNRNIIASTPLITHILWNRFNPDQVRFYN